MSKKAQAGGAAALVALVALFIVVYILLLPNNVREDLLNGTSEEIGTTGTVSASQGTELITAHPGTLDPLKNLDREKVLDSFNLYTEKSAVVLKSAEAIHAENGWLRRNPYNLSFKVTDLANTDNYVLAFDVDNSYGRLIATLNGKQIYDSEIKVGNAEPIKVDKELVKSENSLILSVSDVGLAFWSLNEYDLKNVRVIADFTDVSKKEYKNFFILTATEKENLDNTNLYFVPDCLTSKVAPLKIWINDNELHYSAIPDCGTLSKIPFDPNLLRQGENTITFKAEQGNYFIDRISIKSQLKEMTYPFYYFELDHDDFESIQNNTANVTLHLQFPDKENKQGELNVNGHLSSIDSDNSTYDRNLNGWVDDGQNYLQIKPKTIMSIVDLKVLLQK